VVFLTILLCIGGVRKPKFWTANLCMTASSVTFPIFTLHNVVHLYEFVKADEYSNSTYIQLHGCSDQLKVQLLSDIVITDVGNVISRRDQACYCRNC